MEKLTDLERFEAKYDVAESGCWLWNAGVMPFGHGRMRLNKQIWLAHRLSWTLYLGPIPDGQCVCHTCDIPECVNPAHLFLGTRADNIADMVKKQRQRGSSHRGESNGTAKLTAAQVAQIRDACGPQTTIAKRFGISQTAVSKIKRGMRWAHSA